VYRFIFGSLHSTFHEAASFAENHWSDDSDDGSRVNRSNDRSVDGSRNIHRTSNEHNGCKREESKEEDDERSEHGRKKLLCLPSNILPF
ncbi:hypothetical protein PENTCL1PPCAC_16382, partial [Pristionchus entomophagus]